MKKSDILSNDLKRNKKKKKETLSNQRQLPNLYEVPNWNVNNEYHLKFDIIRI